MSQKRWKKNRIKYIGIFILLCCLSFICKQEVRASNIAEGAKAGNTKVGKVIIGKWKKTYDSRKDKHANCDGVTYTIKWSKVKGASGYEVYSYEKLGPKEPWDCMKKYSKKREESLSFSSCYAVKVKVRAYKIVNGVRVYGKWSKVRKKVVRV